MNFEDAFVDPQGNFQKLIKALSLKECECRACQIKKSIIKWYNIPGTKYSVTYFGVFIFCKDIYPEGLVPHSSYAKFEDVFDDSPEDIRTTMIFNLDIIRRKG
jgi:hypothetical protein